MLKLKLANYKSHDKIGRFSQRSSQIFHFFVMLPMNW